MANTETKIPKFGSESEEAAWWFDNQDKLLNMFEEAASKGRLGHGTVMRKIAEKQAAKATTIRLDPGDISLAKLQAENKGLKYQTYLKMLIHEALQNEESTRKRMA